MNNYFSHDSNARNDEKIIRLRMKHKSAGYGVYFMILERMRDSKNYMCVRDYNVIAFDLREDAALVKSVIEDFGLFVFTEDGKYFYSESFHNRMKEKNGLRDKRSKAGSQGATRRWKKNKPDEEDLEETTEKDEQEDASEKVEEKTEKVEEKAEKEEAAPSTNPLAINEVNFVKNFNYYLRYYDSKISPIRRLTDSRKTLIMTLLERGYTKDDTLKVMEKAASSMTLNGRGGGKSCIPDFDWIFT